MLTLLSFKSFTGRSASFIAFELLRVLISFAKSAIVTALNVNHSQFIVVTESTLG